MDRWGYAERWHHYDVAAFDDYRDHWAGGNSGWISRDNLDLQGPQWYALRIGDEFD